jgi:hypothetical protein
MRTAGRSRSTCGWDATPCTGVLFYGPDASVELIKTGGKLYQSVSTIAGPQPWEVMPASRQGSFGAFLDLGGISATTCWALAARSARVRRSRSRAGRRLRSMTPNRCCTSPRPGRPYPLRVAGSGSQDSALDFLDYDSPVTVTPPKDSLPVPRTWSWLARKGVRGVAGS